MIRAGSDDGSGLSLTVEVTEGRTAVASTDWLGRVVGSGDTAAGSSASDEVCTLPKREMTLEPSTGTEVLRAGSVSVVASRDVLVAAPRGCEESAIGRQGTARTEELLASAELEAIGGLTVNAGSEAPLDEACGGGGG